MYFGPGKRKGYSSFKVVDRSNKSQRSTVNLLPSALPPEHVQPNEQPMREESREEEEGEYLCAGDDAESGEDEMSTPYQMQKERLSKKLIDCTEVPPSTRELCSTGMCGDRL